MHAFAAYFVRSQQNTVKTGTRATSELSRDDAKSMKNRSASAFDGARCFKRGQTLLRGGPGASAERSRDAFGRILAALGSPGAPQDRPLGGIWPSTSRPERVPACPRNGLERPKPPESDFSTIFRRFGSVFRRFSIDFSSNFAGCWYEFGAASFAFVRAIPVLLCCPSLPKRLTKRKR